MVLKEKKNVDSAFHMHNIENHGGDGSVSDYEMRVTKVFEVYGTKRQVSERCKSNTARERQSTVKINGGK